MEWGGWGCRVTSRGAAAYIRSAAGIMVERTSGSTYVVTVDDAAEGVDLLNALLVRARSSGWPADQERSAAAVSGSAG